MFMTGPEPLRDSVMRVLRSEVPRTTLLYNKHHGTDVAIPLVYEEYETEGIRHGSQILLSVSVSSARELTTVDIDAWGAMEYQPLYAVSVYTWCLTPLDSDDIVPTDARVKTLRLRDRVAAIVRATILNNPALDDAERYQLIESSLDEEYSDASAVPNASGRHIAGVVHNFTIRVDEKLDRTGENYLSGPVIVDPHYFPKDEPETIEPWPNGAESEPPPADTPPAPVDDPVVVPPEQEPGVPNPENPDQTQPEEGVNQ